MKIGDKVYFKVPTVGGATKAVIEDKWTNETSGKDFFSLYFPELDVRGDWLTVSVESQCSEADSCLNNGDCLNCLAFHECEDRAMDNDDYQEPEDLFGYDPDPIDFEEQIE